MKNVHLHLLFILFIPVTLFSQQYWEGAISSDWNTPGNWSTNILPDSSSNVILDLFYGTPSFWPQLQSSIVVNSISINKGYIIDVNGFQVTVLNRFNANGSVAENISILNSDSLNSNIEINIYGQGCCDNVLSAVICNDSLIVNNYGPQKFYDGYSEPCTFNGSVTYNNLGGAELYTAYGYGNKIEGDFTVNNLNQPAFISLFRNGNSDIIGDFLYTNLQGGPTRMGSAFSDADISGTIHIKYSGQTPGYFRMQQIKNKIGGGEISIHKIKEQCYFIHDTLIVDSFTIMNYFSNVFGEELRIQNNHITGNFKLTDSVINTEEISLSKNTITNDLIITINGIGVLSESIPMADTVEGDFILNIHNTGYVYTSGSEAASVSGNYTVLRTVMGHTYLFYEGGSVGGDFSYTNHKGGVSISGNNTEPTVISGKVDIDFVGQTQEYFQLLNIKNLSGGGKISIDNIGALSYFKEDTLIVDSFIIMDFGTSSGEMEIFNNHIIGYFFVSDSLSNSGPIYFGGNTFNGNVGITSRGSGLIYEPYNSINKFMGDATFNHLGTDSLLIGYDGNSHYYEDFIFNSSGKGFNYGAVFTGNNDGTIFQTGSKPVIFDSLIVNKKGRSKLILDDTVGIISSLTFINGNILSSTSKELIFYDESTHSGVSDSSKVTGPVTKIGDDSFTFPIGSIEKYIPIGISAPGDTADRFTAQYIGHDPTDDGYDRNNKVATLDNINAIEYFLLSRDKGSSNVVVKVGYNLPPGQVSDTSELRVAHWNGAQWQDEGNGGVVGDNLIGIVSSSVPVSSFSPFALASTNAQNNPLPIILNSFNAECKSGAIELQWVVESGIGNGYFTLERSINGVKWIQVAVVEGFYNAVGKQSFTYLDNPFEFLDFGISCYYRLKNIDRDGNYEYSDILRVSCYGTDNHDIDITPNPNHGGFTVRGIRDNSELVIYNPQGRAIYKDSDVTPVVKIQLTVPDGVYFMRINSTTESVMRKIIIEN